MYVCVCMHMYTNTHALSLFAQHSHLRLLTSNSDSNMHTARHYESCKKIEGAAPPICPLGAGTRLVQNISTWSYWSGGNQQLNNVEKWNQYRIILCGGSDPGALHSRNKILNMCTERYVKFFSEIYSPVREHESLIGSCGTWVYVSNVFRYTFICVTCVCVYTNTHTHTRSVQSTLISVRYPAMLIHMCTWVYGYIYLYRYTYMCIREHACIHVFMNTSIYVYMYALTRIYIYMYMYIRVHFHMYIHLCVYRFIYVYTYVYMCIYMYICMYPLTPTLSQGSRVSRNSCYLCKFFFLRIQIFYKCSHIIRKHFLCVHATCVQKLVL